MHRLSATDLTEGRRPDVIRRGSLPLQKSDSRSSKKESRDSRRSKSSKKKDKKKESKDKKVLTITISHDDNEIVPISDDEQDGSDKVSLNPECPARTFSQRMVPWLKISTMRFNQALKNLFPSQISAWFNHDGYSFLDESSGWETLHFKI